MTQKEKVVKPANDTGLGNTKKPALIRSRSWFLTLNNPLTHNFTSHKSLIDLLKTIPLVKFAFQLERGENGTDHYQGCVYFKNAVSFNTVKELSEVIHWEKCKSWKAAVEYCTKKDTRIGGPWKYGFEEDDFDPMPDPTGWQKELLDMLDNEPSNREIFWCWEDKGKMGKSSFTVWLLDNRDAFACQGKASDIMYALCELPKFPKIIILDIPRSNDELLISYQLIEQLKNGYMFSGKYKGKLIRFNPPHVVIFANKPPEYEKLSADRWRVYKITPNLLSRDSSRATRAASLAGQYAHALFPEIINV